MTKYFFLIFVLIFSFSTVQAQKIGKIIIDKSANGKGLASYLSDVEAQYKVDFVFNYKELEPVTINGIVDSKYLVDYLDNSFGKFTAIKLSDKIAVVVKKEIGYKFGKRKDNYLILSSSQSGKSNITGVVKDATTDEKLIGVQVVVPTKKIGAVTDENGLYNFKASEGLYQLDIRYVGFETISYIVGFSEYSVQKEISVSMRPSLSELEGITVTANKSEDNVKSSLSGVESLNIETIKELPTFMGEVDPIKGLITLPGVSTVGELSSGINVRGGDSGQNLILQDGATIYNPTHLFGFFSAFNPDMLRSVTLYKGGGNASYGGRVSSVMEVDLKNGNSTLHRVSGGVGMISSRLAVEGPIVKNKLSYSIGGRVSYTDWLLKATNNIDLVDNSAKFYDVTGKVFYDINKNNSIAFTAYHSSDEFKLDNDSTFSWSTTNYSLKWAHVFKPGLSSILSVAKSKYASGVDNANEISGFTYKNGIDNILLKYNVDFEYNELTKFYTGIELNHNVTNPGKLSPHEGSVNVNSIGINEQTSLEGAIYIGLDIDISNKLSASTGLRYSQFVRVGSDNIYQFDYDNLNGRYPSIVDSTQYGPNELIESYGGLEPRISFRYLLNPLTSIKASYFRGYQYLHLVSNTAASAPLDYWIASGPYILPEIGDQFSLGYFKNLSDNRYEISVEGFYKEIKNTIDYIEGANTTLNKSLESGMVQGKGVAYGLEFYVKKNIGNFNGWVSYTYSRSLRKFKAPLEIKTINNGEYYSSLHDQPHNLSLIFNYKLSKQVTLSSNFSYSTGRPITIPVSKFSYDTYLSVLNYSQRNEFRMPDYHRLDLSLTIKDRPKSNQKFFGEWVISIYNVYGRKNAFTIYFDSRGNAHKVSVLGTVFPSISYNFKF